MITAPVGFQCPECVKGGPQVRTLRSLVTPPRLTQAIIAVNVAVAVLALVEASRQGRTPTLLGGGNALALDLALNGGAVAAGEWWRLVTSGFLHYGLIHIGFNMFILLQLGTMLEPALGRLRFGLLYVTALLGGALGVVLLQPDALTAGASGAVFGLMGAAVVGMRARGADPMASGLPTLLGINLLLTFALPGISIGGHLGGLLVGSLAGYVLFATDGRGRSTEATGVAACVVVAAACTVASLLVVGA
jgi:membrane associated rhomboid family serine protease